MFFLSYESAVPFKGNGRSILHFCRRYARFQKEEDLREANKRFKEYQSITEKEPKENLHPDPLEFRNVGVFKKKESSSAKKLRFISKDSPFYNVMGDTFSGTLRSIISKMTLIDQQYNPDRVSTLGPDLAAAHFVVCRGGGVKFVGENNFITGKLNQSHKVLPNEKDPYYKVEAIDLSNVNLIYEGISNLGNLKYLSWISFKNHSKFDNWYLDHLSCVTPNIEYLDISGCKKIDHLGLGCLYRFRNLKCVNVEGLNDSTEFKLACLTFETEFPDLIFIGLQLKPSPKSVFSN